MIGEAVVRGLNRTGHTALRALTGLIDLLPARLRFGHVRTATRLLLSSAAVPVITAAEPHEAGPAVTGDQPGTSAAAGAGARTGGGLGERSAPDSVAEIRCVLLTGSLDVGGVEAVIDLLADGLPGEGVTCEIVCLRGGRTAERLRARGCRVHEVGSAEYLRPLLTRLGPQVVQIHNAPPEMIGPLLTGPWPLVPVIHNVELFRTAAAWATHARLARIATRTIAVSDAVRSHHQHNVPSTPTGVDVIPNGVPARDATSPSRPTARRHIEAALRVRLESDFLVVSLARYTTQKNIPGLVAAFLDAVEQAPAARLVVAGEPEDWLEFRRSDLIRRAHRLGHRVHLVGNSHAPTVLAAADAFVLDSFFEGWPVAATEAAVHGLPLVLPNVGGAHELVGGDSARGRVVPSPCGPSVSTGSVAAARRSARQTNRAELARALADVATHRRPLEPRPGLFTQETMVRAHAHVLRRSATPRDDVDATDPADSSRD